jgi:heavy metal translocating P-type ATPase
MAAAISVPLLVYTAIPTLRRAFKVVRNERRLNVDFLDSVAVIVSLGRGQFITAAFLTWMISLGDWIRDQTAAKSKRAITDLLEFHTANAWVLVRHRVIRKPVSAVTVDENVVVYPGEIIPVDGEILRGRAVIDQKTVTGESLPVERSVGDTAYAATVVREGKITIRALRVKGDTTAAQIVRLIEAAPVGETRTQNYAEQFADRLVAPMLLFSGGLYAMSRDVNRLLSMMIVDYGTGIRVAAPTTVLAAMTHAARQGILIKSGSHMEKLAKLDTVIFDKTGTLTRGVPQILDIVSYNERHFPARKILRLAAAAEARLKHPVAEAILLKAKAEGIRVPERIGAEFQIGLGVEAQVNGYFIHIGNERFFRQKKIACDKSSQLAATLNSQGSSTLLFAVDGTLAGLIPYADQVRPESRDVIRTLYNRGVKHTVMLTGDNRVVASAVAAQLGIEQFFSDALPAEKAEIVQQFQHRGRVVAMVGDGINDSPALAFADIGIAMKEGAEVARESADIVLMEDNLWKLMTAIDIAKDAMALMRQNFVIIAALNTLALALAIPQGLVTPNFSAAISNGSAILASLNAVRPILDY